MYKIGKTDNTLCTFCENVEAIYHLLWDFPKVQHSLANCIRVCNSKAIRKYFDEKTFL